MKMPLPITRDLLLIGGGHAHALVLRRWGMNPLPGVRVSVVNPGPTAPYTGMLPGHVAGHYTREQLDIDLVRLCRFAGARLLNTEATHIDVADKEVMLKGIGAVPYDVASIDIGITAEMPQIPGFMDHAVGAKPLGNFATRWRAYLEGASAGSRVAVIGGGVAGCELAMAMAHALPKGAHVMVIEAAEGLTGMGPSAMRKVMAKMSALDISVRTKARITRITGEGVETLDGGPIPADFVVGAAGAVPWPWLSQTDLPLKDGFVTVDPDLRVQGQEMLFAVGDCAHMAHAPRPKAGVFAVRAAPVLHHNLRAVLSGGPVKPFHPQKHYLKLISLGGKSALAEKFGTALAGPLLWRWKDRIDRTFMDKLGDLPAMAAEPLPETVAVGVRNRVAGQQATCGGCGSKLGESVLSGALQMLPSTVRKDVLSRPGDDAAVLDIAGQRQVITTDHLRAFTADPITFARIAALHALGDIWAMGAQAQAVLPTVILPPMSERLQARTLREVTATISAVFVDAGAEIVGGHSMTGAEMSLGFTLTGLLSGDAVMHSGARAGDALILTRPIGSGTVLAAEMAGNANGNDVIATLTEMSRSQQKAAQILRDAHAMTDVTGFGLAGHLMTLCRASDVSAEVDWDAVPVYPGAAELAQTGTRSTLYPNNRDATPIDDLAGAQVLMHDPQTAGGMLAAVDSGEADNLVSQLQAAGYIAACIGQFAEGPESIRVT